MKTEKKEQTVAAHTDTHGGMIVVRYESGLYDLFNDNAFVGKSIGSKIKVDYPLYESAEELAEIEEIEFDTEAI